MCVCGGGEDQDQDTFHLQPEDKRLFEGSDLALMFRSEPEPSFIKTLT